MTDNLNPNSALHWLSAAEQATTGVSVNMPRTEVVEFEFMESLGLLDGDVPDEFPEAEITEAARKVGWPVFLRTDLSSAKHDGLNAVQATSKDEILRTSAVLVSDAAKKMMHPAAFLVREWINIKHEFTAFDGLPIGAELRVFAGPDDVQCSHYYWPEDSIKQPNADNWRELRDECAEVSPPPEVRVAATSAASRANRHEALDSLEVWSVDFALADSGEWYLIDMALAANSWHPNCVNAPTET